MENSPALKNHQYFSEKILVLPTDLLQVGFFRNTVKQGKNTIKHCLSKREYQLNSLYCDTFVETPLFSMMLVEHQHFVLDQNNQNEDEYVIDLSFDKGSKLLKRLKLKGNYTIEIIRNKLIQFQNKFRDQSFIVDGQDIPIFDELIVNPFQSTLSFSFHQDFMNYLNQRKYALTFIQVADFVKIKRKNQTPLFLFIQSIRGLKNAFFTKRYISDIFGLTNDTNKKLSVSMSKLVEKNAIIYQKEVCYLPDTHRAFSRFNIKSVDTDFTSKIKPKEKNLRPKKHVTKTILDHSNVIDFAAFKAKREERETRSENMLSLPELDELDEAWILAVMGKNTIAYFTENDGIGVCQMSQLSDKSKIIRPEIMNRIKIKSFDLQG